MAELFRIKRVNSVSDDTVKAKTGKKWEEWFKILDKAGARMMDHKEIAAHVRRELGLTEWWGQMVTVGYEQDRGLRQKHQKGSAFEIDRSKTLNAPLDAVWAAWHDPAVLRRWLPGADFEIRRFSPNKALHLNWPDGTWVSVTFAESAGKSKIVVTHRKLRVNADVGKMQLFWQEALDRLKAVLES
ncbi:MAG: DUF4287 domain-containing protein [Bryobacteraceae bacterium]